MVTQSIVEACNPSEVLRSIHMALLCVQENREDRPNMSYVVLMLGNGDALPQPKHPGLLRVDPNAIALRQSKGASSFAPMAASSLRERTASFCAEVKAYAAMLKIPLPAESMAFTASHGMNHVQSAFKKRSNGWANEVNFICNDLEMDDVNLEHIPKGIESIEAWQFKQATRANHCRDSILATVSYDCFVPVVSVENQILWTVILEYHNK
ncbi:unnamed protein product [Dovyalis caffra]|uniref:S-locus receptor kinase C-terminal domain-containing protein n=1 Tax=Dovyalis caffra TaxID=77055 RepID=A0AAV1R0E4_9ROSI|nr:unnamed protein product [Dovyalis caffra]